MKKVYIPKEETVVHSELHTELLIVNGFLKVNGKLIAKQIQGSGTVEADEIICDTCTAATIIAQIMTAQKIAVKKLLVRDCRAGEILVSDFIEALKVCANRLSMTLSSIEVCEAEQIMTLPQKRRGMLGMLLATRWRTLFLPNRIWAKAGKKSQPDSPRKPVQSEATPTISEDFLDALIDRLETRGFVYDAPYTPVSPLQLEKEQAA